MFSVCKVLSVICLLCCRADIFEVFEGEPEIDLEYATDVWEDLMDPAEIQAVSISSLHNNPQVSFKNKDNVYNVIQSSQYNLLPSQTLLLYFHLLRNWYVIKCHVKESQGDPAPDLNL